MKRILILFTILLSVPGFSQKVKDFAVTETITRSEFVQLDYMNQKQIIAEISPETHYLLWKVKLADALHSKKLEAGEKAVLQMVLNLASPKAFAPGSEELATYKRILEEADEVLKVYFDWAPSKEFRYLYNFMTEEEIETYNKLYPDNPIR